MRTVHVVGKAYGWTKRDLMDLTHDEVNFLLDLIQADVSRYRAAQESDLNG